MLVSDVIRFIRPDIQGGLNQAALDGTRASAILGPLVRGFGLWSKGFAATVAESS